MHNGPHSSRLPGGAGGAGGGPDESDLLAWVEGEPLSAEANAAVAQALLADPVLARRMELMRSDRMSLRMLGDERAPAGLIAAVEASLQPVLERDLLLGLQDGEPADSHPIVSMVRPEKRGIFQTFLADRAGRRMAMAASLLVLIGGATWWGTVMFSRGTQPIGPLAINDKPRHEKSTDSTMAAKTAEPDAKVLGLKDESATTIARGPESGDGVPGVATLLSTPEAAAAETGRMETPETPLVLAAADVVGPTKVPMDAGLAAELARERKLVIRVVSREATTAPRRVCDRIRKECNAPAWKLAGEQPSAELAHALDAKPFDLGVSSPRVIHPEVPVFAGGEGAEPIIGPPMPVEVPVIEETEPQPVYVVQARLDAATMSQLRSTLEKAGRADEVVFEERYEALPLTSGGAPVLTPAAVLWWTNPPSGWTSWGEVPVVIEPR